MDEMQAQYAAQNFIPAQIPEKTASPIERFAQELDRLNVVAGVFEQRLEPILKPMDDKAIPNAVNYTSVLGNMVESFTRTITRFDYILNRIEL